MPHCLPGWRELPAIFLARAFTEPDLQQLRERTRRKWRQFTKRGVRCRGAASFSGIEVTALGSAISVQAHQRATSSFRSFSSQSQQASLQQVNNNPHLLSSIIMTANQLPQVPKQGVCQSPHAALFLGAPPNQLPRALRYSRLPSWLESICTVST